MIIEHKYDIDFTRVKKVTFEVSGQDHTCVSQTRSTRGLKNADLNGKDEWWF